MSLCSFLCIKFPLFATTTGVTEGGKEIERKGGSDGERERERERERDERKKSEGREKKCLDCVVFVFDVIFPSLSSSLMQIAW